MSDLAKLAAAPRTDVLPGYTLSRARLADFGQVEEELERRHLARAGMASVGLPPAVGESLIKAAVAEVSGGRFKYGGAAFFNHVLSSTVHPLLLYLALRKAHPEISREKAAGLITEQNETAVSRAVLEQFGYGHIFEPKKEGDEKKGGKGEADTTGPGSSAPSESGDSPTPTSAT